MGRWTGLLAAKDMIHEPFLVINADDYYDKEGFKKLHDYMVGEMDGSGGKMKMCMAGFILSNTSSDKGGVTRKICEVDQNGYFKKVTETYEIYREKDHMHAATKEGDLKAEYLLPTIVDQCIRDDKAKVRLLETQDKWFGVTYKETSYE